jgi:hypothetical protein
MGQYSMMNENGLMEGFVAEFEMIPCVIGVDVEILVSSQLDLFKVTEAIVKKMYKANFYHVKQQESFQTQLQNLPLNLFHSS